MSIKKYKHVIIPFNNAKVIDVIKRRRRELILNFDWNKNREAEYCRSTSIRCIRSYLVTQSARVRNGLRPLRVSQRRFVDAPNCAAFIAMMAGSSRSTGAPKEIPRQGGFLSQRRGSISPQRHPNFRKLDLSVDTRGTPSPDQRDVRELERATRRHI